MVNTISSIPFCSNTSILCMQLLFTSKMYRIKWIKFNYKSKTEEIDVDILEMMKVSHIRLLLYNFPLGVQIRFEYNLERWRRDCDNPLQMHEEIYQPPIIAKTNTATEILKQTSQMQSKVTQTDLIMLDVNTNKHKNNEKTNDISTTSRQYNHSYSSTAATKQFRIKSCVSVPPVNNSIDSSSSTHMKCKSIARGLLPNMALRRILSIVPYGIELTNSYRERKSFTNAERRRLISLIVSYYLDNNIKFNLQTSYALERSILQLFPNEKLDMYRTSKRGKLYSRYLNAKAAMKFMRAGSDHSDMDYGDTAEGDDFNMADFSDDSQMLLVHNTADSMSHLDDDTFMGDYEYTGDFIGKEDQPTITEGEVKPDLKIEHEKVPEKPPLQTVILSTELLFNRRKHEEAEGPFENFTVPWHKIPSDILSMLENQEKLGKRENALSNLFVDELRSICTHVPMRVFRNLTQQVITKYPFSFLDKDAEGNLITSSAVPLLQRMRDRNNFLNRSRNQRNRGSILK